MCNATILAVFLSMSSPDIGSKKLPIGYSAEGQERCEQMCLRCVDNGGDVDECGSNMIFKLCCHMNGGHANGCGCREAL